MTGSLFDLAIATLIFTGGHFLLSSLTLRRPIAGLIGDGTYRILYALIAAAALAWMIFAYGDAPFVPLWDAPGWVRHVLWLIMLAVCLLLAGTAAKPNPTSPAAEKVLASGAPIGGIFAITRHPVLWGFALWALGHLWVKGDAAALIFFGGFAVLALGGMAHIETRRAATLGDDWDRLRRVSSALPFAALLGGRARLRFQEIGWWRLGLGLILFALLILGHPLVIGVDPLAAR